MIAAQANYRAGIPTLSIFLAPDWRVKPLKTSATNSVVKFDDRIDKFFGRYFNSVRNIRIRQ